MSQYKVIYINSKKVFKPYETIELKFVLIDLETNSIVTSFNSGVTYSFQCEITNDSDEVKLEDDSLGGISFENGIITVTIEESDTEDFDADCYYDVELMVVVDSKKYICFSDKIYIKEEIIDW